MKKNTKTHNRRAVGSNNKAVAGISDILQNWLLKYCSAMDLNIMLFFVDRDRLSVPLFLWNSEEQFHWVHQDESEKEETKW